jgi:hypothetical protein
VDHIIVCVFRPEEVDCYDFLMPLYFPTISEIEVGTPGQIPCAWVPRNVPPKESKQEATLQEPDGDQTA